MASCCKIFVVIFTREDTFLVHLETQKMLLQYSQRILNKQCYTSPSQLVKQKNRFVQKRCIQPRGKNFFNLSTSLCEQIHHHSGKRTSQKHKVKSIECAMSALNVLRRISCVEDTCNTYEQSQHEHLFEKHTHTHTKAR